MKRLAKVLTILTTLVIILSIAACDRLSPSAPDRLNPSSDYDNVLFASDIWQRYQSDATSRYANDEYKNRWADIYLDGIRTDADGNTTGIDARAGKVLVIRTPGKINTMEFHYRFVEDTKDYSRHQKDIIALCNIKGTDLTRTKIEFIHCRKSTITQIPSRPP